MRSCPRLRCGPARAPARGCGTPLAASRSPGMDGRVCQFARTPALSSGARDRPRAAPRSTDIPRRGFLRPPSAARRWISTARRLVRGRLGAASLGSATRSRGAGPPCACAGRICSASTTQAHRRDAAHRTAGVLSTHR